MRQLHSGWLMPTRQGCGAMRRNATFQAGEFEFAILCIRRLENAIRSDDQQVYIEAADGEQKKTAR
jgi:hypothetical protein